MQGKDRASSRHPREKAEKRQLFWSIVLLLAAIVYTISPLDIIPDVLGPLGFTDDIVLWAVIVGSGLLKRLGRRSQPRKDRGG